jgi:sporulation protein YabP
MEDDMATADDKKLAGAQHNIIMENRRSLTVTGVMDIDSFDEETVIVFTPEGELTIRGSGLHLNKIDVDTGDLSMEGEVASLTYADNQSRKDGFFARLFR